MSISFELGIDAVVKAGEGERDLEEHKTLIEAVLLFPMNLI